MRLLVFVCVYVLLAAGNAAAQGAPSSPALEERTGAEIYRQGCAACHGADGKGVSLDVRGFETEPPDFTECKFATPEPLADWFAVVHEGGRVRGLDRRMPAFGDALSVAEIDRVVRFLWTFCPDSRWPRGDLNFPRAMFTEKAFPENEAVVTSRASTSGPGAVSTEFQFERRLGSRAQFELTAPIESQRSDGTWRSGIGDVSMAIKRALYASVDTGGILSVGGEVALPTGSETSGFGGGTAVIEPFLMAGQTLGTNAFVQVHAGLEVPTDGSAREGYVRTAVGNTWAQNRGFGRAWTPMLEVLWARPEGEPSEWDLVPQMQVTLSKLQHVSVSVGARLPLTERDARHPEVLAYLLWDWFDGGFFEFWR